MIIRVVNRKVNVFILFFLEKFKCRKYLRCIIICKIVIVIMFVRVVFCGSILVIIILNGMSVKIMDNRKLIK